VLQNRIKKIMQADEDVGKVTKESAFLICSYSIEIFKRKHPNKEYGIDFLFC
jgi:hypothetical protein